MGQLPFGKGHDGLRFQASLLPFKIQFIGIGLISVVGLDMFGFGLFLCSLILRGTVGIGTIADRCRQATLSCQEGPKDTNYS